VELGDGWTPFGLTAADLAKFLDSVDRPSDFTVVLASPPLDPIGDGEQTLDRIGRLADLGTTDVTCAISARSATHFIEQLTALAELANLAGQEHR
jgi:hypothetical protein